MTPDLMRPFFIGACALGLTLVVGLAAWELSRARRGISALSPFHLRWRLVSALLWLLVLGSFFVATAWFWPQGAGDEWKARRFVALVSGALALFFLALALTVFDLKLTLSAQKLHRKRFERDLETLAQREIERATHGSPPNNPQGNSHGNSSMNGNPSARPPRSPEA